MSAIKYPMLNVDCYIAIHKTISLSANKMNSSSFKNVVNKMGFQII